MNQRIQFNLVLCLGILTFVGACAKKKHNGPDPEAVKLSDSAATIYSAGGDLNEAVELLERASAIDSNFRLLYVNKYIVYRDLGQFDEAIWALHRWAEFQPENPGPVMLAGIFHERLGDTSAAIEHWSEAIDLAKLTLKNYGPGQERTAAWVTVALCNRLMADTLTLQATLDSLNVADPGSAIGREIKELDRNTLISRVL